MYKKNDFEVTKAIFLQSPGYQELACQHHLFIRPSELRRWVLLAFEDLDYHTLIDIVAVDLSLTNGTFGFELIYMLLNMGNFQRVSIHVLFNKDEIIPSISDIYSSANWMEREQIENLGIKLDHIVDSLLLPEGQKIFPLRKKQSIEDWPIESSAPLPNIKKNPNRSEDAYPDERFIWERFSIFSPETMGNFEWRVCMDPQRVVESEVKVGFYHQGFEKILESKDWFQCLNLIDKVNLGAAPSYSLLWVKNIEDLLSIQIPERAQAIRIVVLEMARIAEHLTVAYEMAQSLELEEGRFFLNCREKIYELFERYSGRRQGVGVAKLGGVKDDLPHGWIAEYQATSELIQKILKVVHRSLTSQRSFRDSLSGSMVDAQTVLKWGISGPSMRASGLNFDLRKSNPFYFYQDIDFDIPVGINGTAYDRYLIRIEEIFQSFRIISQVIDNLPLGGIAAPDFNMGYEDLKNCLTNKVPKYFWHYTAIESPSGEAGVALALKDALLPHRVKLKTPSFVLAQALPEFLKGLRRDQLRSCLASLGIRRFEMDR